MTLDYFESKIKNYSSFDDLPNKKCKIFILLLISYELNFIEYHNMAEYYYKSATQVKNCFNLKSSKLFLPTSCKFRLKSKEYFKNLIIKYATYFKRETVPLTLYQSKLLEEAYTKILWE